MKLGVIAAELAGVALGGLSHFSCGFSERHRYNRDSRGWGGVAPLSVRLHARVFVVMGSAGSYDPRA